MALLNRLFSLRKKNVKNTEKASGWNGINFSENQVRILLFRECELQGQKLLFDSKAIHKVSTDKTTQVDVENRTDEGKSRSYNNKKGVSNVKSCSELTTRSSDNVKYSNSLENVSKHSSEKTEELLNRNIRDRKVEDTTRAEISNTLEYQLARPDVDVTSLGEIIFGSVALTYRGTSLKIHKLENDRNVQKDTCYSDVLFKNTGSAKLKSKKNVENKKLSDNFKKIMCTHIFYPPIRPVKQCAASSKVNQNVSTSFSSVLNDCTVNADSANAKGSVSYPLDVPRVNSTEGDSGCSAGEQSSYSSISSGGQPSFLYYFDKNSYLNNAQFEGSTISVNRCWTRNINMSLDYWPSMSSVPNESCSSAVQSDSFNSSHGWSDNHIGLSFRSDSGRRYSSGTEDSLNNSSNHGRRTKLGLAVIIDLSEHEVELEQYLFENMTFLETMLWRLRDCVYRAYWRRHLFSSIMMEGSLKSALWLRDILCPSIPPSRLLWLQQVGNNNGLHSSQEEYFKFGSSCNISENIQNKSYDVFWKGWFKSDHISQSGVNWKQENIEYFVKELCDLISTVDTKTTNFFLSALITAVLSNHLGWVIPYIGVDTNESLCSALWVQLIEMYGVVGNPARSAQTIITGNPIQKEQMLRISNVLVYFIRCCEIERNLERKINITANEYIDNAMENIHISEVHEQQNQEIKDAQRILQSNIEEVQSQTVKSNDMEMTLLSGCGRNSNFKASTVEETLFKSGEEVRPDINSIYESYLHKSMEIFCANCFKQLKEIKTQECLEPDKILCNHCLLVFNNDSLVQTVFKKFLEVQYSTVIENKNNNAFFNNSTDKIFVDLNHDRRIHSTIGHNNTKFNNDSVSDVQMRKYIKESVEENVNGDRHTSKSTLRRIKSYIRDVNQDDLKFINDDLNVILENTTQNPLHKSLILSEDNKLEQVSNSELSSEINIKHSELFSPIKENILLSNDINQSEDNYRSILVSESEEKENVVFVLGENEKLIGLKSLNKDENFGNVGLENTQKKNIVSYKSTSSQASDDYDVEQDVLKKDYIPAIEKNKKKISKHVKNSSPSSKSDFQRSQSVPPEDSIKSKCIKYCKNCHHSNKYSGVKFNFEQYPQIATNYMISKNLEIENHPLFVEKGIKLSRSVSINFDDLMKIGSSESCPSCKCSEMILQTPSNASELEFSSYLMQEKNDQIHNKSLDNYSKKFNSNDQTNDTDVKEYLVPEMNYYPSSVTHPSTSKLYSIDNNNEKDDVAETDFKTLNNTSNKIFNLSNSIENENLVKSVENCSDVILNVPGDFQNSCVNATESLLKNNKLIFKKKCSIDNISAKSDDNILEQKKYFVNNTKMEEHPLSSKTNKICENNGEDIFTFSDTISSNLDSENFVSNDISELNFIELPMPKSHSTLISPAIPLAGYSHRLIRAGIIEPHYISGAVLQATTEPIASWMSSLRRDLALTVRHSPIDQPVVEAVCVVADVDKWDVQILSNHSNVVPNLVVHQRKNSSCLQGIPVGPSHLVADMLESVLQLWKLHTPAKYCLQHIENQLHEFYVRSFALSELLIATDFCDMAFLTSTLGIHPNDVPLLLAVASTHTPQVTQKYSVSFQ